METMTRYKVTAVSVKNMPICQACVFAVSESDAADYIAWTLLSDKEVDLSDYHGIIDEASLMQAMPNLIWGSVWFAVEPQPDGQYVVSVKDDAAHVVKEMLTRNGQQPKLVTDK